MFWNIIQQSNGLVDILGGFVIRENIHDSIHRYAGVLANDVLSLAKAK